MRRSNCPMLPVAQHIPNQFGQAVRRAGSASWAVLAVPLLVLVTAVCLDAQMARAQESPSQGEPPFVNRDLGILAITVLAERQYQGAGRTPSPTMLIRYHETAGKVVHMWYHEGLRSSFENALGDPIDYSEAEARGPMVSHYFLEEGNHQEYTVGGGRNQLTIHEYNTHGHMNYCEYSGLGLENALRRGWDPGEYEVVGPVSEDEGQESGYHAVYEVRERDGRNTPIQTIHAYSSAGPSGPFERLEYHDSQGIYRTVENSDFADIDGVLLPHSVTVHEVRGKATWRNTIRKVIVNPELSPELMASPVPAPGAAVLLYRHEDGKVVEYRDGLSSMQRITAEMLGELGRELEQAAPIAKLAGEELGGEAHLTAADHGSPEDVGAVADENGSPDPWNPRGAAALGSAILLAGLLLRYWLSRKRNG